MIKAFSITDMGKKRKINQDFVYASEAAVGMLPNLFIVADGMGGHRAGDYASRRATEIIVESIEKDSSDNPIRVIREAVEKANSYVYREAMENEAYSGMGTTTVACTIVEDTLYVANVGDSRLYLIDDEISQITKDHSLVEEMVRIGEIDRAAARTHPDKNIITRAVGAAEDVRIDFFDITLKKGDRILMCSDGLSNMVEDEQLKEILKSRNSLEDGARCLVEAANENGGKDNIAVIVVDPFGE